jgi:restriction endonuclease S subunit
MNTDTLRTVEEIKEIEDAQNHIKELLASNRIYELHAYLDGELTQKYFAEKTIYNMINPNPPTSIEQNAINAIVFLNQLKAEKLIGIGNNGIDKM